MRPTNLCFRSPKERTGDYVLPRLTHLGISLLDSEPRNKSTLPMARRFTQYNIEMNRTESIGPGSYNLRQEVYPLRGTPSPVMQICKEKLYINNYRVYDLDTVMDNYAQLKTPTLNQNYMENLCYKKKPRKRKQLLAYKAKNILSIENSTFV
ncbi:hypothetical protein SteCoe_25343 [Stentor coeruleus]|uniref:Uncharacterized protein n=1 Tax=Stentor coeruleus TaxID=5963 RepID=A0A1R2BFJ5_9CILI|nr:hypothetical protein SteCoe_25343 [Stentor coeruleus]